MPLMTVSGANLFYEIAGSGRPAFVLVHGGFCNCRDWSNQLRELARDFTVLAMDLRGHGRSDGAFEDCHVERYAADVNALIGALCLGPAVLVGHSLGSRVAAEAAWQQPGNASALILVDGSRSHGGFAATEPPDAAAAPPMQASLSDILNVTIGPYADEATRAYVLESMSSASPGLMQVMLDTMKDWDLGRADRVFAELPPGLPVLAIQSTYHDQFTSRRSLTAETRSTPYLEFLKSVLPDLGIRILPETGHFSMLEKASEVTSLIRDFGLSAHRALAGQEQESERD